MPLANWQGQHSNQPLCTANMKTIHLSSSNKMIGLTNSLNRLVWCFQATKKPHHSCQSILTTFARWQLIQLWKWGTMATLPMNCIQQLPDILCLEQQVNSSPQQITSPQSHMDLGAFSSDIGGSKPNFQLATCLYLELAFIAKAISGIGIHCQSNLWNRHSLPKQFSSQMASGTTIRCSTFTNVVAIIHVHCQLNWDQLIQPLNGTQDIDEPY